MKVFKKINITKPWHKEILKYEKQSLRSKKIVKTMDSYINENKYTKNEEVINMMSRRIINMNEFNMEWMQLK